MPLTKLRSSLVVAAVVSLVGCGESEPALGSIDPTAVVMPTATTASPPTWRAAVWVAVTDVRSAAALEALVLGSEELAAAGVQRWFVTERPLTSDLDVYIVGTKLEPIRAALAADGFQSRIVGSGRIRAENATARAIAGELQFVPTVCAVSVERFGDRGVWLSELSRRSAQLKGEVAIALAAADDGRDGALGEVLVVARSDKQLGAALDSTLWTRSVRAAGALEPPSTRECELGGTEINLVPPK